MSDSDTSMLDVEIRYEHLQSQKNASHQFSLQRFELFKAQDVENGYLDVAFEIEGKLLHANKSILGIASEPLKAMMSSRWSTDSAPIKLPDCSYDVFYQFLCFLYSGKCEICNENVFQLTDMGELYGVPIFKNYCDFFLAKMSFEPSEFFEMKDYAEKYSLSRFTGFVKTFFRSNVETISADPKFLDLERPFIEFLSSILHAVAKHHRGIYDSNDHWSYSWGKRQEAVFGAVYDWVEHQAQKKKAESSDDFNLQEIVKQEFFDILPDTAFVSAPIKFIIDFFLPKQFLFSFQQRLDVLLRCHRTNEEELYVSTVLEIIENEMFQNPISSDSDSDIEFLILKFGYSRLTFDFVLEAIVKKDHLFPFSEYYKSLDACQRRDDQTQLMIETVYALAEKRVLKKQEASPNPDFNILAAIKEDLSSTINKWKGIYHPLSKQFVFEFLVAKQILSEDEASKIWDIRVHLSCAGGKFVLTGVIEDEFGFAKSIVGEHKSTDYSRNPKLRRFNDLKFKIPETPSSIQKLKGCEWYLTIEKEGNLALKHESLCKHGGDDYLLAEMKSTQNDFSLERVNVVKIYSLRMF